MVIYSNIKSGFIRDLPTLPNILKDSIAEKLGEDSSEGEILSWQNSLRYMADVVDCKEIPPIFHPFLVGHPFSTSIFKYICNKTLNVTYRMNDEICKFVSHCFYDTAEEKDVIKPFEYSAPKRANLTELQGIIDKRISDVLCSQESIFAIDVTPEDAQCEDSNIYEANFVAEIAKVLDMNGIRPYDYAIITPYRRQVKLIRSLVGDDEDAPLINTVECLQGQDVEYIFITFSASDPAYVREQLEFLLNPNRLNVMISRAKRKAVLVMSKELMRYFFGRYHVTLPMIEYI